MSQSGVSPGTVLCPRCGGAGETLAYDVCPVCKGDGEIPAPVRPSWSPPVPTVGADPDRTENERSGC